MSVNITSELKNIESIIYDYSLEMLKLELKGTFSDDFVVMSKPWITYLLLEYNEKEKVISGDFSFGLKINPRRLENTSFACKGYITLDRSKLKLQVTAYKEDRDGDISPDDFYEVSGEFPSVFILKEIGKMEDKCEKSLTLIEHSVNDKFVRCK
jgi:hypothetical protein